MSAQEHSNILVRTLKERKWQTRECQSCGETYLTKAGNTTCGSYKCENGYNFLTLGERRQFSDLETSNRTITDYFQKLGYTPTNPIDVVRKSERTLFASAAGQIFDDAIYKGRNPYYKKVILSQPVIRLQGEDLIGKVDGYSTSFVNVGTEQWNPNPKEHADAVDSWLSLLSELGIFAGNLSLKVKDDLNLWGDHAVQTRSLRFNYGGLELGIANCFPIFHNRMARR